MTFTRMPRTGNFCVKLISIFLIPTFILSNIAYASPTTSSSSSQSQNITVTNPETIVIPREFGLVKTKFTGKDDRLVIHIQDAHCNYEAQSNIVKILENLNKNYNVSLVSVEGADGVIDTSWFKAFPDDEVRKEVADYFMKKGEITGPEFLSITTDYNIKLFGAETRSYYIDNLNAFTSSYPLKEQTEKYLNSIRSALNKLKTYIYSEDLRLMDAKYQDYDSKKLAFNDYVKFLQVEAEKAKINLRTYENFFKLVSVLVYEKKIDFTVTDKERSALIDNLSKAVSKDALTELVNKSLGFKTGKISSADYYAYLKSLAITNDVDLAKDYPNLYNYIIYNSVYSKIENEKLFNDIKKLEGDIKEKLFTTDDQRALEKLSRHIDILIGLVNIKLLNGDYEYFENNKAEFSHEVFSDFLKKKTIQYGLAYEVDDPNDAVAKALPKLEDFYSIAIKRDKALVDNTLGQMQKDKTKVAVLVTGGFHSEGMSKLLEKQGISYMVVCPSITKDLPTPYIQILTNQKTPLADILVSPVHASEGVVADQGDALAPPCRTALITMSDKDKESFFKAVLGGEALKMEVERLGDDFYSISMKLKMSEAAGIHVGNFKITADVIDQMRNGNASVSSSSVIIAESVMKVLDRNLSRLNILPEDKTKIKNSIKNSIKQDKPLQERMLAAAARQLAQKGRQSSFGPIVRDRELPGNERDGLETAKDVMATGAYDSTENAILADTAYGTTARDEIIRLHKEGKGDEARAFAKEVYTRLHNIDLANTSLIQKDYKGYDIIIVSCTTSEEAAYQQKVLEEAFNGVKTGNSNMNNKVCVLAVVDNSEGGQIIGQVVTMLQSRKPFENWAMANGLKDTDIDSYLRGNKARMAIYHNGGKGERFSPGSQGYGNSRGAQPFGNPVSAANGKMVEDANLILGVVRSTNALAMSMPENDYRVDTYWANQVAYGTIDATKVQRSNYLFDKFVVKVPKNFKMKDLFDYGTAIISDTGKIIKFLANKVLTKKNEDTGVYEDNPDYASEKKALLDSPKGSYDFGSFSMSKGLHFAIMDYWVEIKHIDKIMGPKLDGKAGMARDIDPAFVQIIVPIVNGLSGKALPQLPSISDLDAASDRTAILEKAYADIISVMDGEFRAAVDKVYKKSKDPVLETVEMFIRYRDLFTDIDKVVGSIDLGENSYWFAYKRLLDMSNNRLMMLADILDNNMELEPSGNVAYSPVSIEDRLRAEAARRAFGINSDAVAVFEVNGKTIKLSAEQVKKGWSGQGVEVKGSIIQGKCVLLPGSKIVNSFVNNSNGRITAESSYVETSTAPVVTAENSILIKVVDQKSVTADKEIVADVYRPAIKDPRFPAGQTRMRAPIGYDPKPADKDLAAKMSDKVKFGDNAYPFQEIREMDCNKADNDKIENKVREEAFAKVKVVENLFSKFQPLSFGTSGLRATNDKMTDMEVYINVSGFIDYLLSIGDIKVGDTVKLAGDFRPTTERIARATIKAILDKGCSVEYGGRISTPAITLAGVTNGQASIMITASHNPSNQNGEKFNRSNGEILKKEEKPIFAAIAANRMAVYTAGPSAFMFDDNTGMFKSTASLTAVDAIIKSATNSAKDAYIKRYSDAFGRVFDNEEIVYYRHTSVGKVLLPGVFAGVGLAVDDAGDEDEKDPAKFRALDTENITPQILAIIRHLAWEHKQKYGKVPFAIVSADGDADRPALFYVKKDADTEDGMDIEYIPGDKLGVLACLFLRPDFVATPYTANDFALARLKAADVNAEVVRPLVGSPYCIDKLEGARSTRNKRLFFEVNGGMGTDSVWDIRSAIKAATGKDMGGTLTALPTRDSALPLICALLMAKQEGSVKALAEKTFAGEYSGFTASGLVEDKNKDIDPIFGLYTPAVGGAIFASLAPKDRSVTEVTFDGGKARCVKAGVLMDADPDTSVAMAKVAANLKEYFTDARGFGNVVKLFFAADNGTLVYFSNNIRVTLRPSGNAAQFRFQTLAPTQAIADGIVGMKFDIMSGIIKSVTGESAPTVTAPVSNSDNLLEVTPEIKDIDTMLNNLFNDIPETELPAAFEREVNRFIKSYAKITNKDGLKSYLRLVAARALDVDDIGISKGLQIMAGQTLAIISLIEDDGIWEAEALRLTVNPDEMLKAGDKERGLSYIDEQSVVQSNLRIADKEGAVGLYWRGVEGIEKLGAKVENGKVVDAGPNISHEAIYDQAKFESQSPKMVMYLMLHVGGYHTTVFLHDYIPGTIQHTSTGVGHFQKDATDIKYAIAGSGMQFNKGPNSVSVQRLNAGSWAVAYPYGVDEIVNTGGLIFKDFSVKGTTMEPRELTPSAPYSIVLIGDKEVFVPNQAERQSVTFWANKAPKDGDVSIHDLYFNYDDEGRLMNKPKEIGSQEQPVIATPDEVARAAADAKLAAMRKASIPVKVGSSFNLAAWGQKLLGHSNIAIRHKLATPAERIDWAKRNGILPQDATEELAVNAVVAEELYGNGELIIGTTTMPVPADMKPVITAKELDSAATLSLQSHNFDETFVALEDGEVFLGLREDISDEDLLKAILTGKVEAVLNSVKVSKGTVMFVPAGTLHAYGVVDLQELKKVTAQQDATGTNSFSDRLKLEDKTGKISAADVRKNLAEAIEKMLPASIPTDEAAYTKMAAEILGKVKTELEAKYGYDRAAAEAAVRKGKDALTMTREKINSNIASIKKNAEDPAKFKVAKMVVAASDTGNSSHELLSDNPGFTWQRYTIGQGEMMPADYLSVLSLHRLVVESGEVQIIDKATRATKATISQGEAYLVDANQNGQYDILATKGPAVLYSDYSPSHNGELLVTEAYQAMKRDMVRPVQNTFTMWVPKQMYNQNNFIAERAVITQMTGERVTMRQYDDISKVSVNPGVDVIIATVDDIDKIRQDPSVAATTKAARMLPVDSKYIKQLKDNPYIAGYARELEAIGVILGNTENKDINDKTERGMDLYNLLRARTNISSPAELIALLGVDPNNPTAISNRLTNLLRLPIMLPFDVNREIDGAVKGRRQALWSA